MRNARITPLLAVCALTQMTSPSAAGQWTGISLSAGGGYGFVNHELNVSEGDLIPPPIAFDLNIDGLGGEGGFFTLGVGADYQLGKIVVGAFFDYDFSDMESELSLNANIFGGVSAKANVKVEDQWSLGARIGYLFDPSTLLFVSGGYTRVDVSDLDFSVGAFGGNLSGTLADIGSFNGFFLGGGAEIQLGHGLSLRGEYRYSDLEAEDITLLPDLAPGINEFVDTELNPTLHTARLSIAYKFGLGHSSTAEPADAPSAPAMNWTGGYVGAGLGLGAANNVITLSEGPVLPPGLFDFELDGTGHTGAVVSVIGGYDFQIGSKLVAGVFIDYSRASLDHEDSLELTLGPITAAAELQAEFEDMLMIGGRLGYLTSANTMIFGSAGYARAELSDTTIDATLFGSSTSLVLFEGQTFTGFFLGGGVETRLTENISLTAEYRYLNLGSEDMTLLPDLFPQINEFVDTEFEPSLQIGRVAVTYRFGGRDAESAPLK